MTEDEELQAKIAVLSGRISKHRQKADHPQHSSWPTIRGGGNYWAPQRGTPYGTLRARGGRYDPSHRHRSLVLNNVGASQNSPPMKLSSPQSNAFSQDGNATSWVTKRDRHNQLINTAVFEKKNQERAGATEKTVQVNNLGRDTSQKDKVTRKQILVPPQYRKSTTSVHEIVVDSIRFRVTDGGSKLLRVNDDTTTTVSTPKQTRIGGILFLRSKNGNLYRSGLVKKKQEKIIKKKADLCPRFTTTGYCPHGPGCRYTHDAHKVAICKDFLQTGECQARDACDLSHNPSPHRVPACVHFLRGKCTNDSCRYAHVHVNPGAPVCRAFATLGYCEPGASCAERHVHECPDYANKGICRKPNCPLPHVDRAGQLRKNAAAVEAAGEGEHAVMSDFSSDEEYNQTNSDDVDSDDVEGNIHMLGVEDEIDHELSQQQDFVRFE